MSKGQVPRPLKKSDYRIQFATRQAERGWSDLLGTTRNAVVDAWDFLTKNPGEISGKNHRLRGELGTVIRNGREHHRWQHELPGGARLWFYVDEHVVFLEQVHTHHPNQTK